MKALLGTGNIGMAKIINHPEAQVGTIIQLTDEEIKELVGVVDPKRVDTDGSDLHMKVNHILEDIIIGEIAMIGEVAGFGMTVNDSPFS